jgi:hypothetical protein
MAVVFGVFSSFMRHAYKVVLIFIVCFRYGEENRTDLWNGQNTKRVYKYVHGNIMFVLELLLSISESVEVMHA